MAKSIKVWDGSVWQDVAVSLPDTASFATESYVDTAVSNIDLSTKQDKVAGISDTEIGYLDGVTSNIQVQLNSKVPGADEIMTIMGVY